MNSVTDDQFENKIIHICSLNIQGLKKYADNTSFQNYCQLFDIIALHETWQANAHDFDTFIEGFSNFDSMRRKKRNAVRGSGGVSVFMKDWLVQTNGIQRIFENFRECVVLLFKAASHHRQNDLIMLFTYIPPEYSPVYTQEDNGIVLLNENINEILLRYPNAELFLSGDLNSRIADLQDFIPFDDLQFVFGETEYPTDQFDSPRKSKDDTCNRFGTSLIDLCCTHNIHVLNGRLFYDSAGEITCVANNGRSVVDYMLASTTLFHSFTHFQVGNEDFSDHFPIICKLLLSCHKRKRDLWQEMLNESKWSRYKWKENKKAEFLEHFNTLFSNFKNQISNRIEPVTAFIGDFINIFKQAGTCLKVKINKTVTLNAKEQSPWWDEECQLAKVNKYSLLKKYRLSNDQTDLYVYKAAKSQFKNICRSKRLQFEKQKRIDLLNSTRNPKEYWKKIKRNCNKTKSSSENHINRDDWLNYFKNLLNTSFSDEHEQVLQNITQNNDSTVLDCQITNDEIVASLKSINSNRSPGPDGICIEMIKVTLHEILPFLNVLFNKIYDTGIFPSEWSKSIICPIHKSGSLSNPENFRGISLINSISKIFTNILTIRLQTWAENNNVIDDSQAGFRKNYSTIDNIFSLQALIQKYLCRERGRFYCLFVDFRRAFDSIPHNKIWDSLQRKGLNETVNF